jgi:hypothetical protein
MERRMAMVQYSGKQRMNLMLEISLMTYSTEKGLITGLMVKCMRDIGRRVRDTELVSKLVRLRCMKENLRMIYIMVKEKWLWALKVYKENGLMENYKVR